MENKNCIWIGIGTDVKKESSLYRTLKAANTQLVKEHKGKDSFAGSDYPHLNFYDLSVPRENLNIITRKINEIAVDQKSFVLKIGKVNYFPFGLFFLEIERNEVLSHFHKKIVEEISQLKGDCIDKDYVSPHRKYTEEQRKSLIKYGNPHVLDQFQPHITIGLINDQKDKLTKISEELNSMFQLEEFHIDNIHITIGDEKKRKLFKLCQQIGKEPSR